MMAETNVIFKKFSRQKQVRKRQANSSDDADESGSDNDTKIVQRSKAKRKNPMIQTTSAGGRKQKTLASHISRDSSSSDSEAEDRAKLLGVSYESSKATRTGPQDMGATATLEIETEYDKDAQSQFESAQLATKELKTSDDKSYRGLSAYGQFYEKKDTAAGKASSGFVRKGPIRAPNFLRQSVRWDYQPDLCKDFKETGFCGFGDSCKFLHDRTDYKHGWELERDWREGRYGEDDKNAKSYEIDSDEDELPFKCFLCRESFVDPVVTKCGHYFCEKCALNHFRKTRKCYNCDKNTGGVFNPAKELVNRLKGEEGAKRNRKESKSSNDGETEVADTKMETLPEEAEADVNPNDNNTSDKSSDEND